MNLLLHFAMVLASSIASAQDARDDEIFGASTPVPVEKTSVVDTMQVGGRLEVRSSSSQEEQQKFPESSFSQLRSADIYFDTRPNKDLRALLRLRISEETPVNPAVATAVGGRTCVDCAQTQIDELWFKWDKSDAFFFTLGKQHLKWGSGKLWNPTDFTASEAKDPFALFDRRLGQNLLKIHIPNEKLGFNYYAILQFDDAERNDEFGAALRGEFAFGGVGEIAVSFQTRQDSPIRYGLDLSSALGPFDVYGEAALSRRQSRNFYEGKVDPDAGALPTIVDREDETFAQTVAGVQYAQKYSDDDSVTVGVEYYDNGLGYEDRELELYSLILGDSQTLSSGRRYAGAYVRVPQPGSWNDTSFFLNGMKNLSDETAVVRLTATFAIYKDATVEAFVSQCEGDYGELCFRSPENYQKLAASPTLNPEQKATIAALPTRRTRSNAGLGLSMAF